MRRRRRAADDAAALTPAPEVRDGQQPATRWVVDVDPAWKETVSSRAGLMEMGLYFKPMHFRLALVGPHPATDIGLVAQDENQEFEGRTTWPSLAPDQWVRFAVNRQFFTDNSVRLEWHQPGAEGRYWTTIWLPAS